MINFSVLIVSYNNLELLKNCLCSLYKAATEDTEIIVVDNNSDPEVVEYLEQQDKIILIKNSINAGFGKANNQAAMVSAGKWLILLNNDTVVQHDFFVKAKEFFQQNPGYHLIGPLVLSADGFPQPTFYNKDYYRHLIIPKPSLRKFIHTLSFESGNAERKRMLLYKHSREYSFVTSHEVETLSGVCMFIHREVYEKIGLFDEHYFMYVEDLDFCLRARRAGFRLAFNPEIIITHFIKQIGNKPSISWFRYNNHLKYFYRKNFPFYISLFAQLVLSLKALIKVILNKLRN